MKINHLHKWDITSKEAVALQKALAPQVIDSQPIDLASVKYVAGVDVSVKQNTSRAAVVVLSYPDLEVVESATAIQPTPFPYIPGLLTFREGPVLVEAFEQLEHVPDVFVFDGMGRIHPRRIGIASHMGLWLDKPTIGCGKTHFIGDYAQPDTEKGNHSPITHKGDLIGVVLTNPHQRQARLHLSRASRRPRLRHPAHPQLHNQSTDCRARFAWRITPPGKSRPRCHIRSVNFATFEHAILPHRPHVEQGKRHCSGAYRSDPNQTIGVGIDMMKYG